MKLFTLLPLLGLISLPTAHANTILACNTNGNGWTQSGCATTSVFSNLAATLDWGAPTAVGSFGAHPLEAGLGTAQNNTWDFSSKGDWMATASNNVNVGIGVGAGFATTNEILQRTDNTLQYFNPVKNGGSGWAGVGATLDSYYNSYNVFAGHANSAPIQNPSSPPGGGFTSNTNSTDQFYSGPFFWSHGTPNTVGSPNGLGIPWLGDHLVGFTTPAAQSMILDFTTAGVDAAAFTIVGRSSSQLNGQTAAQTNMTAAGAAGQSNIFEIHIQAFDGLGGTGTLLFDYDMEISGGGFGNCVGLSATTPVPCNDAPVVSILGTQGVFNIRSLLITSATDASGFYLDELHIDQNASTSGQTPEPAGMFLIGGGLILLGVMAKRRAAVRL